MTDGDPWRQGCRQGYLTISAFNSVSVCVCLEMSGHNMQCWPGVNTPMPVAFPAYAQRSTPVIARMCPRRGGHGTSGAISVEQRIDVK